jgi:hypothetical protein
MNLHVAPAELLATHADWDAKAATFTGTAIPPPVTAVCASAAAVAAIHVQVAEGHAQWGVRLSETAAHVFQSAMRFVVADEEGTSAVRAVGGQ